MEEKQPNELLHVSPRPPTPLLIQCVSSIQQRNSFSIGTWLVFLHSVPRMDFKGWTDQSKMFGLQNIEYCSQLNGFGNDPDDFFLLVPIPFALLAGVFFRGHISTFSSSDNPQYGLHWTLFAAIYQIAWSSNVQYGYSLKGRWHEIYFKRISRFISMTIWV